MEDIKVAIGSDHGGFCYKEKIKEYLKSNNISFIDIGTHSLEACDYPDISRAVCEKIVSQDANRGILVCGSGIGVSIAANRFRGIHAALCNDLYTAKSSRTHNNANVLCIGERVIGEGLALNIVEVWLKAEFEGGRHKTRVDMIE